MALSAQPLSTHREQDVLLTLTFSTATSLSGATLAWVLRDDDLEGATDVLTKTTADAVAITDAVNGVATVALTDSETTAALLPLEVYYWVFQRTDPGSDKVLARGTLRWLANTAN